MKIALLLSGKTTCWRDAAPHIKKNIIGNNVVDVYYHTWEDQESPENIKKEYEIKKYSVTPYPENNFSTNCQFTSFYRSLALVQEKYDFYIKCRWDIFIKNPIDFEKLTEDKKYFLPHGRPNGPTLWIRKYGNSLVLPKDFLYIFKDHHVDILSEIPNVIQKYVSEENVDNFGEDILFHHIIKHNIDYGIIPNQDQNGLIRPQNHIQGTGILIYNSHGYYPYTT